MDGAHRASVKLRPGKPAHVHPDADHVQAKLSLPFEGTTFMGSGRRLPARRGPVSSQPPIFDIPGGLSQRAGRAPVSSFVESASVKFARV